MTYLKDPDPKIRRIAAFALEVVVKAYPNGMSSDDIQKVDSDGHRKLVTAFTAGIEKVRTEPDGRDLWSSGLGACNSAAKAGRGIKSPVS